MVAYPSISSMVRHLVILALGLALGQAELAFAASLNVSPILVELGPKVSSQLLTVRNEADREVRFEVSVFAWTEDEQGEMVLVPTDDLVVFPLISSIASRSERAVRVALARRSKAPVERTYRVWIQEMSPPRSEADTATVTIQMRISIPVFVAPEKPKGLAVLEPPSLAGGHVRFRLTNPGNARVRLQAVTVSAEYPDGKAPARHELRAWYLLAGGVRAYDVALDPEECAGAMAFLVEAKWPGGIVSGRVPARAGGCN